MRERTIPEQYTFSSHPISVVVDGIYGCLDANNTCGLNGEGVSFRNILFELIVIILVMCGTGPVASHMYILYSAAVNLV